MDTEHDAMAAALTDTRTAMAALVRDPGVDQVSAAAASFARLKSVTVVHLDHEEAELEPVYQAKQDTPEIKAMGRAFGKTGLARGGRFFAWVLDGATPEERAGVTASVPPPVLAVIGGIFGRGYRKEVAPIWTTPGHAERRRGSPLLLHYQGIADRGACGKALLLPQNRRS